MKQICAAPQALPQVPQLRMSVWTLTQDRPHIVVPIGHDIAQVPWPNRFGAQTSMGMHA
jgi:hypothetical protein